MIFSGEKEIQILSNSNLLGVDPRERSWGHWEADGEKRKEKGLNKNKKQEWASSTEKFYMKV